MRTDPVPDAHARGLSRLTERTEIFENPRCWARAGLGFGSLAGIGDCTIGGRDTIWRGHDVAAMVLQLRGLA
jgi:hypothetical protein